MFERMFMGEIVQYYHEWLTWYYYRGYIIMGLFMIALYKAPVTTSLFVGYVLYRGNFS
jgi:hypothetical protein